MLRDRGGKLGGFGERREPGLASPEPASGDKETAREMHPGETHVGAGLEQQQQ